MDEPFDPTNPTTLEYYYIHLNAVMLKPLISSSALSGKEHNKVMSFEVAKEIWDTFDIAHERVDNVSQSKINSLMAKLKQFVIMDGEKPQEMFDRRWDKHTRRWVGVHAGGRARQRH